MRHHNICYQSEVFYCYPISERDKGANKLRDIQTT